MPGQKFKCHHCLLIIAEDALNSDGLCPICLMKPEIMCALDHVCWCSFDTHSGIKFCPECGQTICPDCGSHDNFALSRVTGYYANLKGFNSAKLQEVKDRHRVNI